MSFTFDDMEGPVEVSVSVRIDRLSARIAQLKSKAGTDASLIGKIAELETRRQRLVNKFARGLKPVELEGRAAEDGAGEGYSSGFVTAGLNAKIAEKAARSGSGRIRVRVRRRR